MDGSIKTKKIVVTVQENGIIRNSKGKLIGRFIDDIDFDGEHIIEEELYTREDVKFICKAAIRFS